MDQPAVPQIAAPAPPLPPPIVQPPTMEYLANISVYVGKLKKIAATGGLDQFVVGEWLVYEDTVKKAIERQLNPQVFPPEAPAWIQEMLHAIRLMFGPNGPGPNGAFGPDGVGTNAIRDAFAPGGVGTNAIRDAFGPNGPGPHGAFGPGGVGTIAISAAMECSRARSHNFTALQGNSQIVPLPNSQGEMPPNFPNTAGELYALRGDRVNNLLAFYNLLVEGSLTVRKQRLAKYLNIGRQL